MGTRFHETLAAAGYALPPIGYGTATFTKRSDYFGKTAVRDDGIATVKAVAGSRYRYLDTSRNYGDGVSEDWIGEAFAQSGGMPRDLLLSTKLDREAGSNAFDAGRARTSLEESLAALGIERVPILFLHDPEHARSRDEVTAVDGPLRELMRMKEEGLATTVGLAAGTVDLMRTLLPHWDLDAVLTHSRFTIVNRNAEPLIEEAVARGMAVINAAVMASGMLATGAADARRYVYREPPPHIVARVRSIERICADFGVSIAAVALRFSLRDPRIASTLVGVSRPERIAQTEALAEAEIPDALWQRLAELPFEVDDPEAGREV